MVGASAYPRFIDFERIRVAADAVGALIMVDMAHIAGLVAAGVHPSPIPHADFVTTTTHKTLRGPRGGLILCRKDFAKAIDSAVFPGIQGGPLMHVIAAKAVALAEAASAEFRHYQLQVVRNSSALAGFLAQEGLRIVTGGTDNHLILASVSEMGLTGKQAETLLDEVRITVNKNTIPFDTRKPSITSGIRLGTPAVTTRGMREAEMEEIARIIGDVVRNPGDSNVKEAASSSVSELAARFPLYPKL